MSTLSAPSTFDQLSTLATDAMVRLLAALGSSVPPHADPAALGAAFDACRNRHGGYDGLAERLHCRKEDVQALSQALRNFRRALEADEAGRLNDTNREILVLQLLDVLERLREADPGLDYTIELPDDGIRIGDSLQQVRALELVLRGLIGEAYVDQDKLIANLRRRFGDERVAQWLKAADSGDILSGTMFSELASLFVNPDEYAAHYERLFEDTPFLLLLRQQRKTLAAFLEDIRGIRNRLAHHKRISAVQIRLLNLYYKEIIEPVQLAFDQAASAVDPDRYLEVGKDELERYVKGMRDDLQSVRDDLGAIGAKVDRITGTVERTDTQVTDLRAWLRKNLRFVVAGIVVLGAATAVLAAISGGTFMNTVVIKDTMRKVKRETSDDPRKELANLGVNWDDNAMVAATQRGDVRTVSLFLQGGMNWRMNTAGRLLENGESPVVDLLLEHRGQLQRVEGDCRQLVRDYLIKAADPEARGKARHAKPLSGQARRFLKAECSGRADVAQLEQAYQEVRGYYDSAVAAYNADLKRRKPASTCAAELMADDGRALIEQAVNFNPLGKSRDGNYTFGEWEALLAELNKDIMFQRLNRQTVQRQVDNYCRKMETFEPNIDTSDMSVVGTKQALDAVR